METTFSHVYMYVSNIKKSFDFYKKILGFLGFDKIHDYGKLVGFSNGLFEFWLEETPEKFKESALHRKKTGVNHVALKVKSKEDIDKFSREVLKPSEIKPLYESPKAFPEYTENYYAVYFEDPDRLKIEIHCS